VTSPLDMSKDPDRYDPAAQAAPADGPVGPLDPALDPDRYRPATDKGGPTLPGLLGEGSQEQERESYAWALGLLAVLAFLLLVSLAVHL
jgi:hypothetical protein